MVKQRVWVLSLVLLTIATISNIAIADDLNPPPWRGQPGTTYQQWLFNAPNPTPNPDIVNNPFGMPATTIFANGPWLPAFEFREGVWPLSGRIETDIPNQPLHNPFKIIVVQVTWWGQPGVVPLIWSPDHPGAGVSGPAMIMLPNGWMHGTWDIYIQPNPTSEIIAIAGDIWIDQLVIDTYCFVPEPGSLTVLAGGLLGIAGLLRRRK